MQRGGEGRRTFKPIGPWLGLPWVHKGGLLSGQLCRGPSPGPLAGPPSWHWAGVGLPSPLATGLLQAADGELTLSWRLQGLGLGTPGNTGDPPVPSHPSQGEGALGGALMVPWLGWARLRPPSSPVSRRLPPTSSYKRMPQSHQRGPACGVTGLVPIARPRRLGRVCAALGRAQGWSSLGRPREGG